ncbi:MAG: 16S rRNA (guanine(527)-N(7))-methyltransferase RsmG [Actinomycetota bacterium]|nr:16S rRNA (guanine(527)-N(7))-methyltransferase RsmG [Actinomycetota bacterium]
MLAADPRSLTSVRDLKAAWNAHVADSLAGLELQSVRDAARIADLGSGAGFPGLVLAVALPESRVTLIESVSRKCDFMREAIAAAEITNAEVVDARSEEHAAAILAGDREPYDVVTARAVARLATLAELGSPLLRTDGALVAWKGKRDQDEEDELARAASATAMGLTEVHEVGERSGYDHRHLYLVRKSGPTPPRLPRRAGMAKKRPFGTV